MLAERARRCILGLAVHPSVVNPSTFVSADVSTCCDRYRSQGWPRQVCLLYLSQPHTRSHVDEAAFRVKVRVRAVTVTRGSAHDWAVTLQGMQRAQCAKRVEPRKTIELVLLLLAVAWGRSRMQM